VVDCSAPKAGDLTCRGLPAVSVYADPTGKSQAQGLRLLPERSAFSVPFSIVYAASASVPNQASVNPARTTLPTGYSLLPFNMVVFYVSPGTTNQLNSGGNAYYSIDYRSLGVSQADFSQVSAFFWNPLTQSWVDVAAATKRAAFRDVSNTYYTFNAPIRAEQFVLMRLTGVQPSVSSMPDVGVGFQVPWDWYTQPFGDNNGVTTTGGKGSFPDQIIPAYGDLHHNPPMSYGALQTPSPVYIPTPVPLEPNPYLAKQYMYQLGAASGLRPELLVAAVLALAVVLF